MLQSLWKVHPCFSFLIGLGWFGFLLSSSSIFPKVVIDHGAVPVFVQLLASQSDDVREQNVWALGNVAGDSPKCLDFVLSHGALGPLLAQLNEHAKLSMLGNATWTLSNFCRGKPQLEFEQTRPLFQFFSNLFTQMMKRYRLMHVGHSLISRMEPTKNSSCDRLWSMPPFIELLFHMSPSVLIPALRTVGNIVTGDDLQTQENINQHVPCEPTMYQALCDLLICPDPKIVTVSLEGLENILKVGESEKNMGATEDVNL